MIHCYMNVRCFDPDCFIGVDPVPESFDESSSPLTTLLVVPLHDEELVESSL